METNKIYQGDCIEELKKLPDESVDCCITDPPYGINKEGIKNDESLEVYYKSLPEIYRVLKDNSFFITFASIGRLPDFFLNNPFKYRWQYIIFINNGMVRGSIGFNRYISVLVFQKGKAKLKKPLLDIFECSTSSKQCKERTHPTEKRLDAIKKLIPAFSKEGDIVLDCFCGTGNILLGSKELGRRFIGIEIDKNYFDIATTKLNDGNDSIPPKPKVLGILPNFI
jgi:DNA modification methylase